MRGMFYALCLAAIALVPGCARPGGSGPFITLNRVGPPHRPAEPDQQRGLIERYSRERGCRGRAYTAARQYAARWLDSVVSDPTDTRRLEEAKANGRFRIQLAQAAARKRCVEAARDAYLEVNDIFTGEAYSGLRQRADFGLHGLRGQRGSVAPTATRTGNDASEPGQAPSPAGDGPDGPQQSPAAPAIPSPATEP